MVSSVIVNGTEVNTQHYQLAYDRVFMPGAGPSRVRVWFYASQECGQTRMKLFLYNLRTGALIRAKPQEATISACDYSRGLYAKLPDITLQEESASSSSSAPSSSSSSSPPSSYPSFATNNATATAAATTTTKNDEAARQRDRNRRPTHRWSYSGDSYPRNLVDTWEQVRQRLVSYEKFMCCPRYLGPNCVCLYRLGEPATYLLPANFVADGYRLTVSLSSDGLPGIEPCYEVGYMYGNPAVIGGIGGIGGCDSSSSHISSSSSDCEEDARADRALESVRADGYRFLAEPADPQAGAAELGARIELFVRAYAYCVVSDRLAYVLPPPESEARQHITLERALLVSRILAHRFAAKRDFQTALLQSLDRPNATYGPLEVGRTRRAQLIRAFQRHWDRIWGFVTFPIVGERYDDGSSPLTEENRYVLDRTSLHQRILMAAATTTTTTTTAAAVPPSPPAPPSSPAPSPSPPPSSSTNYLTIDICNCTTDGSSDDGGGDGSGNDDTDGAGMDSDEFINLTPTAVPSTK